MGIRLELFIQYFKTEMGFNYIKYYSIIDSSKIVKTSGSAAKLMFTTNQSYHQTLGFLFSNYPCKKVFLVKSLQTTAH